MEIGAVKQAFNNELILLKKNLNQAKVQVIHKLTRKAKTFTEKKAPEQLKDKLKRKAEFAVKEVLIIKKIKAKDIGQFIVTHRGQLQEYLNRPQVDHDKACARLLLHKVLQDKYKFIRSRYADIPIKDLFMSRQERRKLKKEARDKQNNKKKGKDVQKLSNPAGEWDIEDVKVGEASEELSDNKKILSDEETEEGSSEPESEQNSDENSEIQEGSDKDSVNGANSDDENGKDDISKNVTLKPVERVQLIVADVKPCKTNKIESKVKFVKIEKKQKDNKNKNFNEKILLRKFKKNMNDGPIHDNKVVDTFFITSNGENYMSVAEPRQPDEVKEVHNQGNRKLRRAIMFGHAPKSKPRRSYFDTGNDRFNKPNDFGNRPNNNVDKQNVFQKNKYNNNDARNFKESASLKSKDESKPEKLHPSWEAKKKQSGILPYQGKKIVFDEN